MSWSPHFQVSDNALGCPFLFSSLSTSFESFSILFFHFLLTGTSRSYHNIRTIMVQAFNSSSCLFLSRFKCHVAMGNRLKEPIYEPRPQFATRWRKPIPIFQSPKECWLSTEMVHCFCSIFYSPFILATYHFVQAWKCNDLELPTFCLTPRERMG